tara:strand:- start:110 stop:304 length:195 start_codon:yes stop_codon:yes gene_type:complete
MICVKTLICQDGVIGLNGYQYLHDSDNKLMTFDSETEAIYFLEQDAGYNIDWIRDNILFETAQI